MLLGLNYISIYKDDRFHVLFLNQARDWFLEIAFVRDVSMLVHARVRVCVCVCVCVHPLGY